MPDNDLHRVRALLESSMEAAREPVTQTVDGLVAVTVNAQHQLENVRILDDRIALDIRAALEKAILNATTQAVQRSVTHTSKAMLALQESAEWQNRLKEALKPFGGR